MANNPDDPDGSGGNHQLAATRVPWGFFSDAQNDPGGSTAYIADPDTNNLAPCPYTAASGASEASTTTTRPHSSTNNPT